MYPISVILPTYKPEAYIYECLMSLYHQTLDRSRFEILVVLNGCDEPYHGELLNYISSHMPDAHIECIQTDSPGVSNARNIALQRARGVYISFIDDDDIVSENYLEALLAQADKDIVAASNVRGFHDNVAASFPYYISKAFERYAPRQQVKGIHMRKFLSSVWGKLISRESIDDVLFDTRLKTGEDCVFMLQVSRNIKAVRFTPSNAVYFRRFREGSALMQQRSLHETSVNYRRAFFRSLACSFKEPLRYNHLLVLIRCLALVRSYLLIVSGLRKIG